jgi:hypothetical protein
MNRQQIEDAVRSALCDLYWLTEVRGGCGFGPDSERTIDLWGISTKRPNTHLSVEIKISRGDFRRDLKKPLKQRRARLVANQFYYATPAGLLKPSDLPPWAGLIEVSEDFNARIEVPAPWFDSSPPTWSFVASLVRRFGEAVSSPPVNILDRCEAALDAIHRGETNTFSSVFLKARQSIRDARKGL